MPSDTFETIEILFATERYKKTVGAANFCYAG